MAFKENLLKKILIRQLTGKVLASFGPPDSAAKIDKDAMRSLLEMSPYRYHRERDLDMYIKKIDGGQEDILVLDNELPIYRTTVEDVAMRKSPYTKEMLSIRKIIKILKDSDVKISRREASLEIVQKACIQGLDLSYSASDIESIAREGADSLENGYTEGVVESLSLLAELLDFQQPPKAFRIRHHEIFGTAAEISGDDTRFGPAVVLSRVDNSLRLLEEKFSSLDRGKVEAFHQAAQGKEKASVEGPEVFQKLKEMVLKQAR